jgi:hypothetical protein
MLDARRTRPALLTRAAAFAIDRAPLKQTQTCAVNEAARSTGG